MKYLNGLNERIELKRVASTARGVSLVGERKQKKMKYLNVKMK
jgi:hypothetical protein